MSFVGISKGFFKRSTCNFIINSLIFKRTYPAPRKRFYKNVSVAEHNGIYEVNLDKRKLKTPLGKLLQLPNESLATAVATEWEVQPETLQLHNMHLTSLCNTVLDNPCKATKESITNSVLEYLATDTLCFRASDPPDLVALQASQWDPIIQWFQDRFDSKMNICSNGLLVSVPSDTLYTVRRHLMTFSIWSLTGIEFAVDSLKSLILTLAIIHRVLSVEKAVECSHLEVNFQTNQWGKVEWSHDLDHMQTMSRVAAAALFVYLNEEGTLFAKKAGAME